MFESGLGGEFATYVGQRSGAFYRLDLGKIHYHNLLLSDLLAEAIVQEGKLIDVPGGLRCKLCGAALCQSILCDGEELVDAYVV